MLLVLFAACKRPDEAPADLDSLLHFFWAGYEETSDEELRAAAVNVAPLVAAESRGTVTDLTDAEQATVDLDAPRDISLVTGVFVAGPLACPLEDTESIIAALDQEELYESATGNEAYDEYERHYTTDADAYFARVEAFLGWQTTYTLTPLFKTYTAVVTGGLRWVPEADGVGPFFVQRSYLPSPATFESETNDFFEQDYQLDVVLPDGNGVVHAYATWRHLRSEGLEDENVGVQNLLLDAMEDYDRDTETVCDVGGF